MARHPNNVLDTGILERYLGDLIGGFAGPLSVRKFPHGQSNPTYLLSTPRKKYVLRRKPDGALLPSAHAIDREYAVMKALRNTGVPVPDVLHLCDDDTVFGTAFFVMDHVAGDVYRDPSLPRLTREQRRTVFDEMNRVLVCLHSIAPESVGLATFGKPGNYYSRQISRWTEQYRLSETERIEEMDMLAEWLPRNVPELDDSACIVHGDYRLDNMIFSPGDMKVLALVDWELSTLGHPYADLAYQCMQLRLNSSGILPGLGDQDRQDLGIPTEQAYINGYCRKRGLSEITRWDFFMAFSFFRFAAILQGVKKRHLEGNASNPRAMELSRLIIPLAGMGLAEMQNG